MASENNAQNIETTQTSDNFAEKIEKLKNTPSLKEAKKLHDEITYKLKNDVIDTNLKITEYNKKYTEEESKKIHKQKLKLIKNINTNATEGEIDTKQIDDLLKIDNSL